MNYIIIIGVAGLVLGLGVMTVKYEHEVAGRATDKATYDGQVLKATQATLAAEQREREIQKRMDDVLRSVSDDGEKRLKAEVAARVRADAVAGELRDQRDALAARAGEAGRAPGASPECQATAAAYVVLNGLYGELDQFAGEASGAAVSARGAGLGCERSYDAVRAAQRGVQMPPDAVPAARPASSPAL